MYFKNTDLKSQNTQTCGFRHSHNTGYDSAIAFQGRQSGVWRHGCPIHTSLGGSANLWKEVTVCGHWVK